MTALLWVLALLFAAGVLAGAYALLAPRRAPQPAQAQPEAALQASAGWTAQAGEEFAGLSESARCDLIFAVGDLEDDRSEQMLVHALRDPADAVALAAAHALAKRGRESEIHAYVQSCPEDRAQRIVKTLALLR